MLKDFDLAAISWKEPRVLVRAALGVLLLANLLAAGFAFHIFGSSAEDVAMQVDDARRQLIAQQSQLKRTKALSGKSASARTEGDRFVSTYMTSRRSTYSTILNELTDTAAKAGIKTKETSITREPVEGSDTLSMMTISANFEGTYANLLKMINLLDRSPRFLIIESLQAAPQPNGNIVNVNIKLNTFVRDDVGGAA